MTVDNTEQVGFQQKVNNVYNIPSTKESVRYLHAAAGFPVKESWIDAIKAGNYTTWPGLNVKVVNRYFPESDETQKGHMKKQRQNVRSTKVKEIINQEEDNTSTSPKKKEHDVYIRIFNAEETMHTDQTGRFPANSSSGNKYIMVLVEIDGNYIDGEPMKDRTEGSLIKTYLILWARITASKSVRPKTHVLDNEASEAFKNEIKKNCKIQLVPPDNHRRNLAERAIQTFKNHFKSVLAGVDDSFPMKLWDKLLPQVILTLNLLRQSNVAPTISAYAYVNGPFDYNAMPLAPMGCATQIYESTNRRKTWAENSIDGWYLRTSPEHYRCHVIYVKKTRSERISDTVWFKHKYITQPKVTPVDQIVKAINDLTCALKGRKNTEGLEQMEALQKLEELLTKSQIPEEEPARVTFEPSVKPPAPSPRVEITEPTEEPRMSVNEELLGKSIQNHSKRCTARVPLTRGIQVNKKRMSVSDANIEKVFQNASNKRTVRVPIARVLARRQQSTNNNHRILRERAQLIHDKETGEYLNYRQLLKDPKHAKVWAHSAANEFGRLAQGVGTRIKGTNTIHFIRKNQVPQDRAKDVTYGSFSCDFKPNKEEKERTRLTAGGDRINYPGDTGTPTADMTLFKIIMNSVISTKGARCMMIDLKDFYLNTPMERPEYMRLKLSDIPEEIIVQYKLRDIATSDGYVYTEITKGMYGLPQAGIIAQVLLENRLGKHGYSQSKIIPGLWTHNTRPILFSLVVDDFAVKYTRKEDAEHLLKALKQDYIASEDWEGTKYLGLTIEWNYEEGQVHLWMPGYVSKALLRFEHTKPDKIQNSPHPHNIPTYGAKVQYAEQQDESPLLDKADTKYVQQVAGTLLYYGRAVDPTILPALSSIASEQAAPTERTMKRIKQLLDYCASQEEAIITYNSSKMILAVHSDAGYANEKKARSRAGGHFFLSNNEPDPPNNGAILTNATIIKNVMSSAAEAEIGALYLNAREAVYLRQILIEMGHPQPPTPIQTDNTTAEGVINHKIQPKRTKAMDMRFHWLRDREQREQFRIYWRPGGANLADYWTKHHAPTHHANIRAEFLTKVKDIQDRRRQASMNQNIQQQASMVGQMKLQGCVRLPKYGSYILASQRPKIGGNLNS